MWEGGVIPPLSRLLFCLGVGQVLASEYRKIADSCVGCSYIETGFNCPCFEMTADAAFTTPGIPA